MAFFKFGNFDALVFQSGGISESKVNELIERNNEQILSKVEQKIAIEKSLLEQLYSQKRFLLQAMFI